MRIAFVALLATIVQGEPLPNVPELSLASKNETTKAASNKTANATANSTSNTSGNATKENVTKEVVESKPVKAVASPPWTAWGDVWNRYDQNVTRAEVFLPIPAPYDTADYPKYKPDKFRDKGNQ